MIETKEYKVMALQNHMRVQVPRAAVLETRQVLDGMPNILKLTRVNEAMGWLEMDLNLGANHCSVNPYQVNRILSALIRAKIPIMSFTCEDGSSQEVFLNSTTDTIK
jgi:hypothetical protein